MPAENKGPLTCMMKGENNTPQDHIPRDDGVM